MHYGWPWIDRRINRSASTAWRNLTACPDRVERLRPTGLQRLGRPKILGSRASLRKRDRARLPSNQVPAMSPEMIQPTIGLAFLAVWALVGQIIIRARK
jgi:hypothetical protein